jgi:hypothetical protein
MTDLAAGVRDKASWPSKPPGDESELVALRAVLAHCRSPIPGLSPLLGNIIEQYHKKGLVGEERNIAQLSVTCFTRHLPREYRRHAFALGPSGSGKTNLLESVLEPFDSDVEHYTRMTGAGLEHRALDGKILFLEQIEGNEPTQLRCLMSGGKLRVLVACRDSSGKIVSSTYAEIGLPVVVSTFVEAADSQLLNRASTLKIDESDAQTGRITRHKLESWTNIGRDDKEAAVKWIQFIDEQCRRRGSLVKEIKMPFALQLEEDLPKVLSMRRGLDRLLTLIGAIAFVKWALGMRPYVELKGQIDQSICIVALPEDLSDALYCLGDAFQDSLTYFLARAKQVYDTLQKNGGGTSEEVGRVLDLSPNRAREYLNHLVKLDFATRTKEKGTYKYETKPHDINPIKLQATYTETDLQHWFLERFPNGSAQLHNPPEAKTGFEFHPPVEVDKGFESGLGAAERTGQDTGSVGRVVPDVGFGGGTTGSGPVGAK